MLLRNVDDTFTTGPRDVVLMLHDTERGTYHPAFFEEAPFPGGRHDVDVVRLKSRMHHTEGAKTIEEATVLFDDLARKLNTPANNRW